jgi:hypothetical protein
MPTSGLTNAVNAVLTQIANVPFDWSTVPFSEKSYPNVVFQKVLMWNDQVNRSKEGKGYDFECPACFLELRNMKNDMFASGVSYSEYVWRFHIVDKEFDAGDEVGMDQNLTVIGFRDAVKQALAGFQPPQCTTLFAVNEEQDHTHTDIYHYILDLQSGFTDTKGSVLDPDQTTVIFKTPPTNAEIDLGFGDPPAGVDSLTLEIEPS